MIIGSIIQLPIRCRIHHLELDDQIPKVVERSAFFFFNMLSLGGSMVFQSSRACMGGRAEVDFFSKF